MSKKVAFVINSLSLAGAENITFNVFVNLLETKVISKDSIIILLSSKIDDAFVNLIKTRNLNLKLLTKSNSVFFILLYGFINSIIFFRKNKFDTIFVNLSPSLFLISILKKLNILGKAKIIFTEHSVSNNRPKNKLYLVLEKLFYNEFDFIICISENVRNALIKRLGNVNNVVIIKNGLPPILINDKFRKNIRDELGIPNDAKILLMTSRIGDGKDHFTLLKSFESIFYEKLFLLFIGEGNFSGIIKCINSEVIRKNIFILGKRVDARLIMNEVDINILSSAYEGVSGVTLESFYAMKPYIGSNVEGIKDLVGTPYSLFEFGNPTDLSNKILNILNDSNLADEIIKKNFSMLKEFDFTSQISQIKKLI